MTREQYAKYLETDHWKKVAKRARNRAKRKCQLCGRSDLDLNVHHNNYDCLYDEKPSDLIVLCESCHKKFHGVYEYGDVDDDIEDLNTELSYLLAPNGKVAIECENGDYVINARWWKMGWDKQAFDYEKIMQLVPPFWTEAGICKVGRALLDYFYLREVIENCVKSASVDSVHDRWEEIKPMWGLSERQ